MSRNSSATPAGVVQPARRTSLRLMVGGGLASAVGTGWASPWPSKPVRLIVPVAPGGVYDAQARIVAERMSALLGQPVIVENKPGAESKLGTVAVANAAPDGHTILVCGSSLVHGVVFNKEPQYQLAQFLPLGMLSWMPIGFGVTASLPVETLAGFVRLARSKPGELAFGSIALSTRGIGETFKQAAGIDLIHIPYKGESPLTTDLVAGHVPSGFMTSGGFRHWYGKGGKIKWLAVSTPKRMQRFADVPTFVELGYPQLDLSAWLGFVAPAATPPPVADTIAQVIAEAMRSPQVIEKILDLGVEPHHLGQAQFAHFIDRQLSEWSRIQKHSNIEMT